MNFSNRSCARTQLIWYLIRIVSVSAVVFARGSLPIFWQFILILLLRAAPFRQEIIFVPFSERGVVFAQALLQNSEMSFSPARTAISISDNIFPSFLGATSVSRMRHRNFRKYAFCCASACRRIFLAIYFAVVSARVIGFARASSQNTEIGFLAATARVAVFVADIVFPVVFRTHRGFGVGGRRNSG